MSFFKKKSIHKENDFEIVCTDVSSIKNVKNWEKNRPPDQVRIQQIKNYYDNNDVELIPGIICIWKINNEEMYIYDGLHRYLAANQSNNKKMKCIVKFFTGKQSDVISDFENINMGVSLPFLYLEDNNELKRSVCENIAQKMCLKFPSFVSPSRKPHRQNFNRDNLIEMISSLEIDFTKKDIDVHIFQELLGLNFYAKDYVSKNKIAHPSKCDYHNFYLFYLENDYIRRSLEKSV